MKRLVPGASVTVVLSTACGLIFGLCPGLRAEAYSVKQRANTSAVDAAGVRYFEADYPGSDDPPWVKDRIKTVGATYPEIERLQRHQGRIFVTLFLDLRAGTVTKTKVVTSTGHPALDDSFLAACRQWRWKSGKWREVSVAGYYALVKDARAIPRGARLLPASTP